MRPLHYYFLGTGSWFFSFGIQNVTFTWLVTMVLKSSPQLVGLAQMTMLIPALFLMLVGGSLADRNGGRCVIIPPQFLVAVAPFILITVLVIARLSFGSFLLFPPIM